MYESEEPDDGHVESDMERAKEKEKAGVAEYERRR